MTKNVALHAERVQKVRTGLAAATISMADIEKVLTVFDALVAEQAREVAARTNFKLGMFASKGGESGEKKRQMTRALLFVQDLLALYHGDPLAPATSVDAFNSMWRGDEAGLQAQVRSAVAELVEYDNTVREIAGAEVKKSYVPPAVRTQINLDSVSRQLFHTHLQIRGNAQYRVGLQEQAITSATGAWNDAKIQLVAEFTTEATAALNNFLSIQTAADNAYKNFEAFFRAVGEEYEGKLSLVDKFFGAVADYAPWPASLVGTIGQKAVGLLHADTTIPQARDLGPRNYFNSDVPVLVKASEGFSRLQDRATDLTRLGVNGAAIAKAADFKSSFSEAQKAALKVMHDTFHAAIRDTFGGPSIVDSDSQLINLFSLVQEQMLGPGAGPSVRDLIKRGIRPPMRSMEEAESARVSAVTVSRIEDMRRTATQAIRGMRRDCERLSIVDASTLQPFIELQLYADYMAQVAPGDDFSVSISEELIRRLESDPHNLIIRKSGKAQTDAIFAQGKLPWASGHSNHVGAIILFFRWYSLKVNPFHIAVGATSPADVRLAMEQTIQEIGVAIARHKVRRRIGHNTADWAGVRSSLPV